MERYLSAVIFIDVVGYSKMMAQNENRALQLIQHFTHHALMPTLQIAKGRLIKSMGDGWMISFNSCHGAVNFAKSLKTLIADDELHLRYGVHLGDVLSDGSDLFGDVVNTAARLEAISATDAITISNSVYMSLDKELKSSFIDQGELLLKNLNFPIRIWSTSDINASSSALSNVIKDEGTRLIVRSVNFDSELLACKNDFERLSLQIYQNLQSKDWLRVAQTDEQKPKDYIIGLTAVNIGHMVQLQVALSSPDGTRIWADSYDIRLEKLNYLVETVSDSVASQVLIKLIKFKKDFVVNPK